MTKKYTLNLTITSSSFPRHPHLAVLVAKRMWEMSHPLPSISHLTGIPEKTIPQLAKFEDWGRIPCANRVTGYHGPFLFPDETEELYDGQRFEDDPEARRPEQKYRPKDGNNLTYTSSALGWI
jgi:hypothetical protein